MDVDAWASVLNLALAYEPDVVVLSARDDGTGLAHRNPFAFHAGRHGLARLRQLVEPAGGTVDIATSSPTCVAVQCRMPRPRRGDRQ